LAARDRAVVDRVAARLIRDRPGLTSKQFVHPSVCQGVGKGPALILGDQQEILMYAGRQPTSLDYRMGLLAQEGDMVAVHRRHPDFEDYLCNLLGLGKEVFAGTEALQPLPRQPVARLFCHHPVLEAQLDRLCRGQQDVSLIAYHTTGNLWLLAHHMADRYGVQVQVAGPSPAISRLVNDKLWFAERVREMFGADALPPSHAAFGPAALAGFVSRLAKTCERVVVKVPTSAGSLGNIGIASRDLRRLRPAEIRERFLGVLSSRGWDLAYPLLVGVWDCDAETSPSVQVWIPAAQDGPPIIEGIYEQAVEGQVGTFIGARRVEPEPELAALLVRQAAMLSALWQRLGYFGRCSFDAIVSRHRNGRKVLHWIECNGRWGGVSVPMSLANRLRGSSEQPGLVIVQQAMGQTAAISTSRVLEALDGLLLAPGKRDDGIVLVSPPRFREQLQLNFLATAPDQPQAELLCRQAFERLASL
jgi:hypothetical protein